MQKNEAAAHLHHGVDIGERAAVHTGAHDVGQSVHFTFIHPVALRKGSQQSRQKRCCTASTRTFCAASIGVLGIGCGDEGAAIKGLDSLWRWLERATSQVLVVSMQLWQYHVLLLNH